MLHDSETLRGCSVAATEIKERPRPIVPNKARQSLWQCNRPGRRITLGPTCCLHCHILKIYLAGFVGKDMIYIQVPSCGDGYVNLSAVFLFLRFYLHGVVLNISGVIYTANGIFTSSKRYIFRFRRSYVVRAKWYNLLQAIQMFRLLLTEIVTIFHYYGWYYSFYEICSWKNSQLIC